MQKHFCIINTGVRQAVALVWLPLELALQTIATTTMED